MVIAGPGTGKTQIIGMRTANIILKAGVNPENILITTFTEAGVIAIRERLISMIGSEAYKVHVATVHSFAQDVIKTFPELFTQEKLDTPIDGIESMEVLTQIVSELLKKGKLEHLTTYGDTLFYVRSISSTIGKLKQEWISPEDFAKSIEQETEKSLAWLEEKRNNKRIKRIEKYEQEHETNIWKLKELLLIFKKYNEYLREKHLYDFNDMINFVLEKFRQDENLRAYYAETYQYIMLDEYQDTNNPQNEIVDLILSVSSLCPSDIYPRVSLSWAKLNSPWSLYEGDKKVPPHRGGEDYREKEGGVANPNIMVVGDDDQSIYRFQGANIENMLDFTSKYPQAKIIVLDKNYRSYQSILDISRNLIEHNSQRLISRIPGLEKQLYSQVQPSSPSKEKRFRDEGNICSLYLAQDEIDERLYIKDEIEKKIQKSVAYADIAIIVRNNREVREYSDFLKEYNIPVSSKLDSNILESDYVKAIFSFFDLLENPYSDEKAFLDLLRSDLLTVDNMDILKINTYLYRENYSRRWDKLTLFDVLRDPAALQIIGTSKNHEIHDFVEKYLDVQQQFSQKNFMLAMSYFLETFKILEYVEQYGSFEDLQDVYTLFHTIKAWTSYKKDISLSNIIERKKLYETYGYAITRVSSAQSDSGVQIVTAHSSKGLEYEYVYIPWLYTGNWDEKSIRTLIKIPEGIAGDGLQFAENEGLSDVEKKSEQKQMQAEEDRRLLFVALTRAKKWLFLSFPASIVWKAKIMSPFLTELGELAYIESRALKTNIQKDMMREMLQESRLISYSQDELVYIENFLKNYKLSVSDLNAFLVNPKDFLYRTIFRYPFQENENSIFGTMYHRTLELFYKKILETGEIQDYSYMEYVYLRQLEKEYLTHEERQRLKKRGLESLQGYYETYNGTFQAPLKTEYKFSRRNIFFWEIPITGIIDKIELLSDDYTQASNSGTLFSQSIKITDYKTGSIKYMGEIKWEDKNGNKDEWYERGRYGRQLLFYRLLFENDHELSNQYSLEKLELDFCEWKKWKYKRLEVEFSQEEYEDFKKLVQNTYTQMTDINFWKEYLGK